MLRAWNEVVRYAASNAQNVRKGYRLAEITDEELLRRTLDELQELIGEPTHLDELCDTMACLFHYAQRQGWTPQMIDREICRKLALRFTAPVIIEQDWHGFGHVVEPPHRDPYASVQDVNDPLREERMQ